MKRQPKGTKPKRRFIVVMRGPSAAYFGQGENMVVTDYRSALGPVTIVYTTRWLRRGEDVTLPGHLWIEIAGSARSLEEALTPFANAGLSMLPLVSLSANAAIAEPEIEVGFDATRGITERDYFQSYVATERSVPHLARRIDVGATIALMRALHSHSELERLLRGANQYRLALDSWRLGRESLSLAHLWMSVEALTPAKTRAECLARGLQDRDELIKSLGVDSKSLDPTIRRDFLLKGDNDCYKKAKKASDGFEHGYLGYDEIQQLSKEVRPRMAAYVRTAILEMSGIDRAAHQTLTSPPFDTPIGHWPVVKYIRGKLIGKGDELAAEGNAYPFLKWKSTIKSPAVDEKGNIDMTDTLTAELANGISFRPESYQLWRAE